MSLSGLFLASSTSSLRSCKALVVDHQDHRAGVSRAIGMKSARVNFGARPNSLVHFREAGNRGQCDQAGCSRRALRSRRPAPPTCPAAPALVSMMTRLLENRFEHGRERPADHVGGAAWRKRIDEGNRMGRIGVLREGRPDGERRGCSGTAGDKMASVHVSPPWKTFDLPGFSPGLVVGWDAIARCGGQSSINDCNGPCPTGGPAAHFHRKTAHHEAGRRQRLEVMKFLDMAVTDLAAGPMTLPDE